MKVDVLASARVELREASRSYRDQSAVTARRFALEIKAAVAAIAERPESYARWGDNIAFIS